MEYIVQNSIKCLPVFQNQQDFLISVFTIGTILKFTRYTKRLIVDFNDEGLPVYNPDIQRQIESGRVQRIADFLIEDPNATFPTNIVLHLPSVVIEEQRSQQGFIEIELSDKVFEGVKKAEKNEDSGDIYITIIDGQHRIKGIEIALERIDEDIKALTQILLKNPTNKEFQDKLERYSTRKRDLLNIQLVVSFFIDKTLEYQAMIFATINRTQKRVSDSLVSSLFGLNTEDSPQKTALQIALALNASKKSPFHNRINLYGNTYERMQSPPLSQATMVKSIVNLISENQREAERDRFRKRRELRKRMPGSIKALPFRMYYANDEDKKISDILFYYFKAVEEVFQQKDKTSYWAFNPESMKPTNVIQTTAGYYALLNILIDILQNMPEDQRFDKKFYEEYLQKAVGINFQDQKRYPFTTKSRSILYLDMSLAIWPAKTVDDPRERRLKELLEDNS